MLPSNIQEKQRATQHTYIYRNLVSGGITKVAYDSEYIQLTRTARRSQPMCHSTHERNPKEAQLEQEEKTQHQTLTLTLKRC